MGEAELRRTERRRLVVGCTIFAAIGAAVMVFLNWPALGSPSSYHGDLTQSPHWVAYHGDRFPADDLLLRYATYNETPLQNAIYWLGTSVVDVVLLNKIVGIAIHGLTAALFFLLVSEMSGPRAGVVAATFFVIFPRGAYEIAGGFSKAWAIGFVLVAVYVVETRRWSLLLWVMPLAALAYPVAPVLIGAIVAVGLVPEWFRSRGDALRSLGRLAGGSALALVPLLYKYFTPPEFIGDMVSTATMKGLWASGESSEATLPLWEEVLSYPEHPFFVFGTVALLILLARRGLVWRRSWTALVLASTIAYLVADLVVPQLYLPDRYTRYSIAVLLVLWHAENWSRVLEAIPPKWPWRAALAALVATTVLTFSDTFRPGDGGDLSRWEDESAVAPLARAVGALPPPVLLAGHPYHLSHVMVQARQPVLVIHRMFHHWFEGYKATMNQRVQDSFRALYARDVAAVNALVDRHGATHLVVPKRYYDRGFLSRNRVYKPHLEEFIRGLIAGQGRFVLNPPPASAVLYEDGSFWLVRLPLDAPGAARGSRDMTGDEGADDAD